MEWREGELEYVEEDEMKVIKETEEVVAKGLEMAQQEIRKEAQKQGVEVPEEVLHEDSFLLKFLRAMKFDPKRTADLFLSNWTFRVEKLHIPKARLVSPFFFSFFLLFFPLLRPSQSLCLSL